MKLIFGGILLAAGILIAGGSGLCSLAVLFGGGMGPGDFSMLPLVLMIGLWHRGGCPPIEAGAWPNQGRMKGNTGW